jgi:hypothetical protein
MNKIYSLNQYNCGAYKSVTYTILLQICALGGLHKTFWSSSQIKFLANYFIFSLLLLGIVLLLEWAISRVEEANLLLVWAIFFK